MHVYDEDLIWPFLVFVAVTAAVDDDVAVLLSVAFPE